MKKIAVIGSVLMDLKGYPLGKYESGGRNAGRIVEKPGGVACNVCWDLSVAGVLPVFVTVLEDTAAGYMIVEQLTKVGTDLSHSIIGTGGIGKWLAVFDETGEVVASVSQRPDLSGLIEVLVQDGRNILAECDGIAVALDIDRRVLDVLFALAKELSVPVYGMVSNMTIALRHKDLIAQTSCFVCNRNEAEQLFANEYMYMHGRALAEYVRSQTERFGIDRIVVTDGAQGAVYCDCGYIGEIACEHVKVVDTTGCGDAFFAGTTAGLVQGMSLADACRLGAHMAALTIGSQDNVCPVNV